MWNIFRPFVWEELTELDDLPAQTRRHYAEMATLGRRPMLWWGAPHVLIAGTLDTAGLDTIRWGDPP